MAMALLLIGLDAVVPFETQEAARELVRAYGPPMAPVSAPKPRSISGYPILVRSGRRTQIVEAVVDADDGRFVALQFQRLFKGQLDFQDAAALLADAIRRRGWRLSVARIYSGVRKALGDFTPVSR